MSSGVIFRPVTRLMVVTPASLIPHGTKVSKASRLLLQLIAKPCIAVPRATRSPIAAIFRSGVAPSPRIHTPERPSTCSPCTPRESRTSMMASSRIRT